MCQADSEADQMALSPMVSSCWWEMRCKGGTQSLPFFTVRGETQHWGCWSQHNR